MKLDSRWGRLPPRDSVILLIEDEYFFRLIFPLCLYNKLRYATFLRSAGTIIPTDKYFVYYTNGFFFRCELKKSPGTDKEAISSAIVR